MTAAERIPLANRPAVADVIIAAASRPLSGNEIATLVDAVKYAPGDNWCDCRHDGYCLNRARAAGMLGCEHCGETLRKAAAQ